MLLQMIVRELGDRAALPANKVFVMHFLTRYYFKVGMGFVKIGFSYAADFFQTRHCPINGGPADRDFLFPNNLQKLFDVEMGIHGKKLLEYQFPLMGDEIPLRPE